MTGVGLRFPEDLEAWQRWADRRYGLNGLIRKAKTAAREAIKGPPRPATLYLPTAEPTALVVMDNLSPSCKLVIHKPLEHADLSRVAILTEVADPDLPNSGEWTPLEFLSPAQLPASIEHVLSLGAFLGLSGRIKQWATKRDIRFSVVQHGLMTPWAPPLSDGDHLLAWSDADGHYWGADRPSITWEVVGSQMLWEAVAKPAVEVVDERPIMLGQLHGIELDRRAKLRIYRDFCLNEGADYRPHPIERDALSRAGHAWLRRSGVQFEESGRPVTELGRPVVAIFSTGVLEAAQRGLPAWVHHPNPPEWIVDFWQRYGLSPFGSVPTQPWELAEVAPSVRISRAIGLAL